MNILQRIDLALSSITEAKEGPSEATVIDINDQAERMEALRNCRGPCIGWEDYAAGRDYQPPMFFNSKVPYGPKDEGKYGVLDTAHEIQFTGENPFSRKYGGVRPWSPGEVMKTFLTRGGSRSSDGLAWTIATKGFVSRAGKATRGRWSEDDIADAVQLATVAAERELHKDEARPGTRFTSWIGVAMQQGIVGGVPAGYRDEYRKVRGFFKDLLALAKSALVQAKKGWPAKNSSTFIKGEKGVGSILRRGKEEDRLVDQNGHLAHAPGPDSPYGRFGPQLLEIAQSLIDAIRTEKADVIENEINKMETQLQTIVDQEDTYFSPGVATSGAAMSKPRDYGTMTLFNKASSYLNKLIKLAERGVSMLAASKSTAQPITTGESQTPSLADQAQAMYTERPRRGAAGKKSVPQKSWAELSSTCPISKERRDPATEDLREKLKAAATDEERAKIQAKIDNLPSFPGVDSLTTSLVNALKRDDKQALSDWITWCRDSVEILKHQESITHKSIGATTLTTKGRDTDKEVERTNMRPLSRDVDELHTKENREMIETAIRMLSPWRDRSTEKSSAAKAAQDALNDLEKIVTQDLDTEEAIRELRSQALNNSKRKLGEYHDELNELYHMVMGLLRSGGDLNEAREEIDMLRQLTKQDMEGDRASPATGDESLNPQQYRVLLRLFGVKNYPERGTVNDPEIDENGDLSAWAEQGYPAIGGSEAKDNDIRTPDGRKVARLGDDMGVSDVMISKYKKAALAKFEQMIGKLQQDLSESGEADLIDMLILQELRMMVGRMLLEEVLPGATRLIYG